MSEAEKSESLPVSGADTVPLPQKALPAAALRALEEAALRRASQVENAPEKEINGRNGPEPVRYGDWEVKGIACDF